MELATLVRARDVAAQSQPFVCARPPRGIHPFTCVCARLCPVQAGQSSVDQLGGINLRGCAGHPDRCGYGLVSAFNVDGVADHGLAQAPGHNQRVRLVAN